MRLARINPLHDLMRLTVSARGNADKALECPAKRMGAVVAYLSRYFIDREVRLGKQNGRPIHPHLDQMIGIIYPGYFLNKWEMYFSGRSTCSATRYKVRSGCVYIASVYS